MLAHVVFGLFFALLAVCVLRGLGLTIQGRLRAPASGRVMGVAPLPVSALGGIEA
jgi:hypothetical protein